MKARNLPSFKIELSGRIQVLATRNVGQILDSGMFASHKFVGKCQDQIREIVKQEGVYMTSSGSSALETCAFALREQYGLGRVLIPANTFVATALAFERMGFTVEFYRNGIFETHFEIPLDCVGLVIVELGGWIPRDIHFLVAKAKAMGLWVCEDACQAFGSELGGQFAGTFGDIGAYSFFATKVLTGGEGGAVVVNDSRLRYPVKAYRDFGKTKPWVSFHPQEGWNCRMNEFGAAVLSAQLDFFEEIVGNRAAIKLMYEEKLGDICGLQFLREPQIPHRFNGYKVITFLDSSIDKDLFLDRCGERGVKFQGNVYNWVLPDQPIYQGRKLVLGEWRHDLSRMICLPAWYGMKPKDIDYVVQVVQEVVENMIIEDRLEGLGYIR